MKLKPVISRLGGKVRIAPKLLSLFPPHTTYIEPFIGGGSVYFLKEDSEKMIINDIDKDVYDIYHDILDIDNIDDFDIKNISEEEFYKRKNQKEFKDNKERFLRNIILSKKSYSGIRKIYASSLNLKKNKNGINFLTKYFQEYKNKLNKTIILNEDFKKVIEKYDNENAFLFLDPPYSKNDKSWGYLDNNITKENLLPILQKIKGKFLMTYDLNDENIEFFKKYFEVKLIPTIYKLSSKYKKVNELIIINYKL
jgi:DNA adenine methylase